jgi:putative endonuclease
MKTSSRCSVRKSQRCYFVYILSSLSGILYVGLTDDLRVRIIEHQNGTFDGFTKKYNINRLMYYESYTDPLVAEKREKQVKKNSAVKRRLRYFAKAIRSGKILPQRFFQSIGIPRYARDFRGKLGDKAVS